MFENALNAFIATDFEYFTTCGHGAMVVELFPDGSYRVLSKSAIGNRYDSEGLILPIPQLDDDDDLESYEDGMFDALADALSLHLGQEGDLYEAMEIAANQ